MSSKRYPSRFESRAGFFASTRDECLSPRVRLQCNPEIPVIGMGGVSSAEDVIEMMLAGATAVEVGAANLVNPFASRDIVRDLPRVMEKYGIENLKDIIGGVK